jgi:hypothetical protein
MAGRHRTTGRRANSPAPPQPAIKMIDMTDGPTGVTHRVTDDSMTAIHRAEGRYPAVCGVMVQSASLTDPGRSRCTSCMPVPAQRSGHSRGA